MFSLLVLSALAISPSPSTASVNPPIQISAEESYATVAIPSSAEVQNSDQLDTTSRSEDIAQGALFERVFGPSHNQSQSVNVPFFIDEQQEGTVFVSLATGGMTRFQAAPLLQKTATILRTEIQMQLETAVDAGSLSLETLRQIGLEVVFDERKLELHIQIPAALRQVITSDLMDTGVPPEAAKALPTSHVSGYINLRGSESLIWAANDSMELGRQPLQLSFNGAINVENWVLEGGADFVEDAQPMLTRGDFRLVRDDPDNLLRYVVGDLSIPVTGYYQNSIPMAGITVERNYALQPYRVVRPVGQYSFFLQRPSKVEVYINGNRIQTLQLPAGTQDVRNLPLSLGVNAVQLVITDDLGQVQQLDFSPAVAGNLLATGLEQFSYSLGFPLESSGGARTYDWDLPTLSLSHRWGISNNLTLGGYLQADATQQLVGMEGAWASSVGNWGWDVAMSHANEVGTDIAARVQYDYALTGDRNPTNRSFSIAAEYRGPNFTTFGDLAPSDYSLALSAYYSQLILDGINMNLGGNYQVGRNQPSTYSISLGLSQSLDNGLSTGFNLSYGRNQEGQEEERAYVSLSWLFPKHRQSAALTTEVSNTDAPITHLTWSISPERTLQSVGGSVDFVIDPHIYGLLGYVSYANYRFTLDLAQKFSVTRDGEEDFASSTQLNFGTALVFADGHFGWSRPITNSFAIVVPRGNLRSQTVGVNPSEQGYAALADHFGPAVIPDLQPYYVSAVNLTVPGLPLGYDIGPDRYTLLPSYRSGTVIQVGTDATVFLRGILVDTSGNPIALQAGEVVSISDPHWQTITLITNRIGRFALSGFKPGQYEIRLGSQSVGQFEIPNGQEGVYDIGSLTLTAP